MMNKILIVLATLCITNLVFAQADSVGLKNALQQLDKAMIEKNYAELELVLHKDVSFGHSSGWAQTKTDILQDFRSGKLVYNKLDQSNLAIVALNKDRATVRMTTNAEGSLNSNAFKLTLHVLQVWVKSKKGWQLFARQGAKQ